MHSKGLCDRSWPVYTYISTKKFQNFLNLSKYSLSEVHSNTGRLLIEFNRLQYTLAAPEVFVAFANPVCLPSWYRVSIVRNTNIDRSKPHPYSIVEIRLNMPTLLYCTAETQNHPTFSYWVPEHQGTGYFMRSECIKLVLVSFTLISHIVSCMLH